MALVAGFRMDGRGGAEAIVPEGRTVEEMRQAGPGFVWLHFARPGPEEEDWLSSAGLDGVVRDALDAAETRPRCTVYEDGVLMNMRGVNLSEGAQPEDMVSLRLWVTGDLVISVQRRQVKAVQDVIDGCARMKAPGDPGELVARLALRLADRAEPVVAELNERIDDLEDGFEAEHHQRMRGEVGEIRRVSIILRRFMFPLRDALSTLGIEDVDWLTPAARSRIREATERVTRLAEDLDSIRDRAEVVHDQVLEMRAEVANRQMLILSVVAAIFLPLGLLTGLLGINVGGVPGAEEPWAFWAVCGLLAAILAVQIYVFRKLGLLRW
ncbi:zinc transporter ZntB [Seohaeicola nanhaiensis]|uniref:Zinc transporter ZntB n=1 Tax=Seohaeicola nanhaiensis TaxID=1387282 RepID=A0ABV9KPX1_9RHOB